jgi:hypothetical protein
MSVKDIGNLTLGVQPFRDMIFQTPTNANEYGYRMDCAYFSRYKRRKFAVRAWLSECPESFAALGDNPPPQLHIMVIQLAPGVHLILPIYRGSAAWPVKNYGAAYADIAEDADVVAILTHCQQVAGIDPAARAQYNGHVMSVLDAIHTNNLLTACNKIPVN